MQGRDRDAEVEKGLVDKERGTGSGMNWKTEIDISPTMYKTASGSLLYSTGVQLGAL